jgi:hypothetical protein
MEVGWDSLRVRWKRDLETGVEEVVVVLISRETLAKEGEKMLLEMANECRRREGRILLASKVVEPLNISYLSL